MWRTGAKNGWHCCLPGWSSFQRSGLFFSHCHKNNVSTEHFAGEDLIWSPRQLLCQDSIWRWWWWWDYFCAVWYWSSSNKAAALASLPTASPFYLLCKYPSGLGSSLREPTAISSSILKERECVFCLSLAAEEEATTYKTTAMPVEAAAIEAEERLGGLPERPALPFREDNFVSEATAAAELACLLAHAREDTPVCRGRARLLLLLDERDAGLLLLTTRVSTERSQFFRFCRRFSRFTSRRTRTRSVCSVNDTTDRDIVKPKICN